MTLCRTVRKLQFSWLESKLKLIASKLKFVDRLVAGKLKLMASKLKFVDGSPA